MSYVFKPAVREACPLLIGLVGPSGSGKTLSALRLAAGMQKVRGGNIVVIDTEARRALHYADDYRFIHCEFNEPFGSKDYAEVIKAAAKESREGVVIVDSMSHEHEGMGGYLMFHDAECQRLGHGDEKKAEAAQWRAWAKPAAARQLLINTILQIPSAFIFCFRAKEKSAMVKNQNGKYDIVTLGWQAIAGDAFVYEQTVRCLLPAGSEGVADWTAEGREHGVPKCPEALKPIMLNSRQLDERHGEELALWAAGKSKTELRGAPREPEKKSPKRPSETGEKNEPETPSRLTPVSLAPALPTINEIRVSMTEWRDRAKELGKIEQFDKIIRKELADRRVKKLDELAKPAQEAVLGKMRMLVESWIPSKKV
jgi:hypothetical protein